MPAHRHAPNSAHTWQRQRRQGLQCLCGYSWQAELASCIRPWMTSAITLEVAAHRQKCPGQNDTKCLMVRELQDGQKKPRWAPFDGEISGYQHSTGKRQLLRLRKDKLENVPADGASITFTFLKKCADPEKSNQSTSASCR